MDCAVIPLMRHKGLCLVQTVDFFYPLVDDPRVMGKIALANVVSDMYAMGVLNFDNMEMLITAPTDFSEKERDVIISQITEGFQESAKQAGCGVNIKNMSINPWCIIGGIATSVCQNDEVIMPCNAQNGDVIILTKPLGTHLATNSFIWMQEKNEKYEQLKKVFTDNDINKTFQMAVNSMTFLNKSAALLMHKYYAHAATDITGFGLLGHAKNLAEFQNDTLCFEISRLPIMLNVLKFGEIVGQDKKLKNGKAVETSGGLLICLPPENATQFCEDFIAITNGEQQAWIVGSVKSAEVRDAVLVESPEFLEVEL